MTNNNRLLKINLEELWDNPNEYFTVRYKDINIIQQKILSKRIKICAQQETLRRESGPTIEKIEQALNEINPIIFSENMRSDTRWCRGHQRFGVNMASSIVGYQFNKLCQAIYWLTCRKKALTIDQVNLIASTTCRDWERVHTYVNQRLGIISPETTRENPITEVEELGLEDIHRAAQNVPEQYNPRELTTPDPNYDEEIPLEQTNNIRISPSPSNSLQELARTFGRFAERTRPDIVMPRVYRNWFEDGSSESSEENESNEDEDNDDDFDIDNELDAIVEDELEVIPPPERETNTFMRYYDEVPEPNPNPEDYRQVVDPAGVNDVRN